MERANLASWEGGEYRIYQERSMCRECALEKSQCWRALRPPVLRQRTGSAHCGALATTKQVSD